MWEPVVLSEDVMQGFGNTLLFNVCKANVIIGLIVDL